MIFFFHFGFLYFYLFNNDDMNLTTTKAGGTLETEVSVTL